MNTTHRVVTRKAYDSVTHQYSIKPIDAPEYLYFLILLSANDYKYPEIEPILFTTAGRDEIHRISRSIELMISPARPENMATPNRAPETLKIADTWVGKNLSGGGCALVVNC
jgi:hypothetical protein